MNYILFNVIMILAGFAAIWSFSVGSMIFLVPMALVAKFKKISKIFIWPVMGISVAFQICFWGAWSAFCVVITIMFTHKPEVTWDWLYWITGFIYSLSLIFWFANKERKSSESLEETRSIEKGTTLYSIVAIAAFLVFAFAPLGLKSLGLQKHSVFPEEFIGARENFMQSITVIEESSDLINRYINSGETSTIPKVTEQQIYSKIEKGLALSKEVNDAFLDYIHPDLKIYYRNKFIAGTEIYYEGLKSDTNGETSLGVQRQVKGIKLITEWANWWDSHNKELADKGI